MKDVVDFETAKRLRDAGFPQPGYPIPDPVDVMGRVMYDADGDKFMCFWQEEDGGGVISLTPFMNNKQDCKNPLVFAPTATDILRELPEDNYIGFESGHFVIKEFMWFGDAGYEFTDVVPPCDNPAEGLAKRWLRLNEK